MREIVMNSEEKIIDRRGAMKNVIAMMFFSFALVFLTASTVHAQNEVTVGGKNYTEQILMADITSRLLREHGYDVDTKDNIGSTMLRKAQVNGEVDIYWEYTGTSIAIYNKMDAKDLNKKEAVRTVRRVDGKKGLQWLQCSNVNDTWAVAVRKNGGKTAELQNISDLAQAYRDGKELRFGVTTESAHREDGLPGLETAYDFNVPRPQTNMMTVGLYMRALRNKELDVAMITSTDGRLEAFNLRTLEDDKSFFPNYAMCPVIRAETLKKHPELKGILKQLASKLDNTIMRQLNAEVDVKRREAPAVAEEFLKNNGLI